MLNFFNSVKSEKDDGPLSSPNFPKRCALEKMDANKPVLTDVEQLRGKITDEQLEDIMDAIGRK